MKNISGELCVSAVLLVLLGVILNPWQMAMPDYIVMALLIGITLAFIVFATFLWREGRGDERDRLHRMIADRMAYLAGSAILVIGIVASELAGGLDVWLLLSLAVMVAAKFIGLIYTKNKL